MTKEEIKNWINSSDFNVVLEEITTECLNHIDTYCDMRERENVGWMSPINPEGVILHYFMLNKKYNIHGNTLIDIKEEIINKYGSLLRKKMEERLRTNNLHNDF